MTDCHIIAGRDTHYPKVYLGGGRSAPRYAYAHHVAFEKTHGPIPPGMFVCHTCDNRRCVNPVHLFLGTSADNLADMRAKGRGSKPPLHKGVDQWLAKLTPEAVADIRAAPTGYGTGIALARKYGVSNAVISKVRLHQGWRS